MGAFVKKWFHLVLIFVFAYLAGSLAGHAANQFLSVDGSSKNAIQKSSPKPVALTENGIPIYSASADGNWGLSFPNPGQAPVGNTTNDYLKQFNAYYMGEPGEKVIYLTFDAGYENGNTPAILEALTKHQAPATFFVVGTLLESNPELIKQILAAGNTIGNHTWHHKDMSQISTMESFSEEIQTVEKLYQQITGQEISRFYRPPQGKYSEANLKMAQDLGYHTFFWSLAYVDWYQDSQPSHEEAFEKLLGRIHPGAIVLLHSTSSTNAEILDELLTKWEEMGYHFASLDDLIKATAS